MDWGTAAQWGGVLLSLASMVVAVLNRRAERIGALERRVGEVESEMKHMPAKDSVHNLEMAMVEMRGQLAVVIERVGPIKAIAERLQEAVLEGNRK